MCRSCRLLSVVLGAVIALAAPVGEGAGHSRSGRERQRFAELLEEVETNRAALAGELARARGKAARRQVRAKARAYVVRAIVDEIAPAWVGMPWTMAVIDDGLAPNARVPGKPGKGISCSWFVVSVLENAGLELASAKAFAGTIAVHLQHSLAPRERDLHRFWNVSPRQLEAKLIRLGDGLYVIGLNCHIGFVHVDGVQVTFIHSSYTAPYEVVREPLTESVAIELSESAGYVVSPLFQDARLVDHWLTGRRVPFTELPRR